MFPAPEPGACDARHSWIHDTVVAPASREVVMPMTIMVVEAMNSVGVGGKPACGLGAVTIPGFPTVRNLAEWSCEFLLGVTTASGRRDNAVHDWLNPILHGTRSELKGGIFYECGQTAFRARVRVDRREEGERQRRQRQGVCHVELREVQVADHQRQGRAEGVRAGARERSHGQGPGEGPIPLQWPVPQTAAVVAKERTSARARSRRTRSKTGMQTTWRKKPCRSLSLEFLRSGAFSRSPPRPAWTAKDMSGSMRPAPHAGRRAPPAGTRTEDPNLSQVCNRCQILDDD